MIILNKGGRYGLDYHENGGKIGGFSNSITKRVKIGSVKKRKGRNYDHLSKVAKTDRL